MWWFGHQGSSQMDNQVVMSTLSARSLSFSSPHTNFQPLNEFPICLVASPTHSPKHRHSVFWGTMVYCCRAKLYSSLWNAKQQRRTRSARQRANSNPKTNTVTQVVDTHSCRAATCDMGLLAQYNCRACITNIWWALLLINQSMNFECFTFLIVAAPQANTHIQHSHVKVGDLHNISYFDWESTNVNSKRMYYLFVIELLRCFQFIILLNAMLNLWNNVCCTDLHYKSGTKSCCAK